MMEVGNKDLRHPIPLLETGGTGTSQPNDRTTAPQGVRHPGGSFNMAKFKLIARHLTTLSDMQRKPSPAPLVSLSIFSSKKAFQPDAVVLWLLQQDGRGMSETALYEASLRCEPPEKS